MKLCFLNWVSIFGSLSESSWKRTTYKKTTAHYMIRFSRKSHFFPSFVRRHSVCSARVQEAWFLFSQNFDWVAHEGLGIIAISFLYRLQHVTTRSTNHSLWGNWRTLRIPREDWGNLREHWGKIWAITTPPKNPINSTNLPNLPNVYQIWPNYNISPTQISLK